MSYPTANTAFKDGYARRFEIALGCAIVIQLLAMWLVPPQSLERARPAARYSPDPIPPESIYRPQNYRIVPPADAGHPITAITQAVDEYLHEIDVTDLLPTIDINPFAEPSVPSGPGGAGPFWTEGSAPYAVKHVAPEYPSLAREAQGEGTVVVEVLIDRTGRVLKARVVRSNALRVLETAALNAARQWLFEPARQRGIPVPTKMEIPFEFRLGR